MNDTINDEHVNQMTNVFYKDYDIENIMRFILLSDWFYDEKNIGTKIKSPMELLVGMRNVVPVDFKNAKQLLNIQKLLGQILLNPPNVAGWKGGRNWIDSNTIVLRLKLPSLLLNHAYISKAVSGTTDRFLETKKAIFKKQFGKRFNTVPDWNVFNAVFKNVDVDDLETLILACKMNDGASRYLGALSKVSKQEYCVQLMSLPEYQMC